MMYRVMFLAAAVSLFVLAAAHADDTQKLGRFVPPATGIGGGTSTAADRSLANRTGSDSDTELVHYYRRPAYHGGFYGGFYGYGGFGYGGFGYGVPAYYRGYRHYSYYAPGFAVSHYSTYLAPVYGYSRYYYAPAYYGWRLCADDGLAEVVPLNQAAPKMPPASASPNAPATPAQPMMPPASSSYKYDGGPKLPVPMPAPDQPGAAPMAQPIDNTSVKIGLKSKPNKPFSYPAYGEK